MVCISSTHHLFYTSLLPLLHQLEIRARKERERIAELSELLTASKDASLVKDGKIDELSGQLKRSDDKVTLLTARVQEMTEEDKLVQERLNQIELQASADKKAAAAQYTTLKTDRDRLLSELNLANASMEDVQGATRRLDDKVALLTNRMQEMGEDEKTLQERLLAFELAASNEKKAAIAQQGDKGHPLCSFPLTYHRLLLSITVSQAYD